MKKIIKMNNISKSYHMGNQSLQVLKRISLTVEEGEFVSILGPSGSGKSTLMNIIGCIDTADEGEYILDGEAIESLDEEDLAYVRNRKIGFVFQKFNLIAKYTALYNVALPLLLRGHSKDEAFIMAEKSLNEVGLGDRLEHKPMELSGGQQQRVAVARALVSNTRLVLADEPTGNLDSVTGNEILQMFTNLNNQGHTIVLITHDLDVANKTKRIVHVKDGKIYH